MTPEEKIALLELRVKQLEDKLRDIQVADGVVISSVPIRVTDGVGYTEISPRRIRLHHDLVQRDRVEITASETEATVLLRHAGAADAEVRLSTKSKTDTNLLSMLKRNQPGEVLIAVKSDGEILHTIEK